MLHFVIERLYLARKHIDARPWGMMQYHDPLNRNITVVDSGVHAAKNQEDMTEPADGGGWLHQ